jgi:haloalkane dehalogenase
MVVPDHMGFGKSETPRDRTYWLQDHIDNLEAFVLDLGLHEITLVMHDFGGPVGMGLLARRPELVSRVVALNAPAPFGQPALPQVLAENASHSPGSAGSPARRQTAPWARCSARSAITH